MPTAAGRIDRHSPVPFYFQMAAALEHEITAGRWATGTRIPSEPELCKQFGISRSVVRRALRDDIPSEPARRPSGLEVLINLPAA